MSNPFAALRLNRDCHSLNGSPLSLVIAFVWNCFFSLLLLLSPRFTSPRFTNPRSSSPRFTSPRFTSPRFTSPRFTSPRFTSSRFTSPRFTSPVQSSRPVQKARVDPDATEANLSWTDAKHLRRRRLSVADVKLPCNNNLRFLRNTAVHMIKFIAWTCNKIRQPETASNVSTRSILVSPQTQKIAGGNNIRIREKKRLHDKTFRIQKLSDSKFPL